MDARWVFRGLGEALLYLRSIDSVDIDFLEDPIPPHDVELSCTLSRQLKAPLAVGEDVVGTTALRRLADHVGVLRVDATTCGGITATIVAVHVAQTSGCMALPHVFAPLHVQLACALPGIESVEHIPASVGADPLDDLLREPVQVVDGRLRPSEEPGAGMALNWQAIREFAHEFLTVEASA